MERRTFSILLGLIGTLGLQAAEVPRPSPEYQFQLPNGTKVQLNQYKGKLIVLEFLLTTCDHCQRTSKLLSKLFTEYGPKGVQPLGVAINDRPDVPGFVKEFGVNYPVGTAPRETVHAYLQHSIMAAPMMMPQLVFIDQTGTIRAQYSGNDVFFQNEEKNMRAMIEKLLKEAAPATTKKRST